MALGTYGALFGGDGLGEGVGEAAGAASFFWVIPVADLTAVPTAAPVVLTVVPITFPVTSPVVFKTFPVVLTVPLRTSPVASTVPTPMAFKRSAKYSTHRSILN